MSRMNPLLVRLEDLEEGKPFDALVAGTFIGMSGRKFEFKEEDLAEYVENTKTAIEATKTEDGEVVGLPIDIESHDEGDGAGYIVDAELEDGIVRFTPKWNDVGLDLIERNIRRWFSGTWDIMRKVAQGGTLTNWPATRDNESGDILLRPIELETTAQLSQPIYRFQEEEESLDEQLSKVREAWWAQYEMIGGSESWPVEVFEDHLIIDREDGYWKVEYEVNDEDTVVFADATEWTKVGKVWIELIRTFTRRALALAFGGEGESHEPDNRNRGSGHEPDDDSGQEDPMKINLETLEPEQIAQLEEQAVQRYLGEEVEETDAPIKLSAMLDKVANRRAVALVERAKVEDGIARLSEDLTGGTDEAPLGIPVEAKELQAFLLSLDEEQREVAESIFARIVDNGLVQFSENGHGKHIKGGTELDEIMKLELEKWLEGGEKETVAGFFQANQDMLGPMEDYDLSAFDKQEETEE